MQIDFRDKVVVVTGAASGIGKALANRFGELHAHVYALDVKSDVSEVVSLMRNKGHKADAIIASIDKPKEWEPILTKLNRIDVLCNVAAIIDPSEPDIDEIMNSSKEVLKKLIKQENDLRDVFAVNYCGPYLLSLFVAEKMKGTAQPAFTRKEKEVRRGTIINIGSTNVFTLHERRLAYVPLKAALHKLTELMAKGLSKYGIRVNCVAPGATEDTLIVRAKDKAQEKMPLGLNKVDDVVDAIVFFASDYAHNVTGQLLAVDGGRTVNML